MYIMSLSWEGQETPLTVVPVSVLDSMSIAPSKKAEINGSLILSYN
jgi:hypothetical protein